MKNRILLIFIIIGSMIIGGLIAHILIYHGMGFPMDCDDGTEFYLEEY